MEEFNVDSKAKCDQLNLAHVATNKKYKKEAKTMFHKYKNFQAATNSKYIIQCSILIVRREGTWNAEIPIQQSLKTPFSGTLSGGLTQFRVAMMMMMMMSVRYNKNNTTYHH